LPAALNKILWTQIVSKLFFKISLISFFL